ncbi:MAG: SusD/RagB family nutrient-binding outer membrane lipoprotein [Cyclobacteriaceae bacterium]
MKNIKRYSLVGLIMVIFSTSCGDDFFDINTDPNLPGEASVQLVFPAGTAISGFIIGGQYQILGGIWSQHWAQSVGASQYANYDSYDIQSTTLDARGYGELYNGALNDLKYVRDQALATENWNYYLMSTVISAYTYQVLTDLYDNIPFTDALQGLDGLVQPKFDEGTVVYDGLITMLDEALEKDLTVATSIPPGADDIIFGGDMDMWVQFANTLKLKIYLRQVNARESVASAGIQALYQDANFLAADAHMTQFADELNRRNPVYETEVDFSGFPNLVLSNTLLTYLDNNGDARLDALFNFPNDDTDGPHVGLIQGNFRAQTPTNKDGLSQPALAPLDPIYFISEAESYFLQAEAIVRGYGTGDAKAMYEAGIDASFAKLGLTPDATLYAAGGAYEFPATNTGDAQIKAIIEQKWVSMVNSQGLESFFEQNRTGFPDFYTVAVNNVTAGNFPRRLLYPDTEISSNKANVPAQVNVFTNVWWHK